MQFKFRLESLPTTKPAIDFAYYNSVISNRDIVDSYKKEYENLDISKPENTALPELMKKEQELKAGAEKAKAEMQNIISDLEAQLDAIHAERPIEELTVKEVLQAHPEWKKEVDDNLKNDRWAP